MTTIASHVPFSRIQARPRFARILTSPVRLVLIVLWCVLMLASHVANGLSWIAIAGIERLR